MRNFLQSILFALLSLFSAFQANAADKNTIKAGNYQITGDVVVNEKLSSTAKMMIQAAFGDLIAEGYSSTATLEGDENKLTVRENGLLMALDGFEIVGDAIAFDTEKKVTFQGQQFTICSESGEDSGALNVTPSEEEGEWNIENCGVKSVLGGVLGVYIKNIKVTPIAPKNTIPAGDYRITGDVVINEELSPVVQQAIQIAFGDLITEGYSSTATLEGDEDKLGVKENGLLMALDGFEIVGDAIAFDTEKKVTFQGQQFTICSESGEDSGALKVTPSEKEGEWNIENCGVRSVKGEILGVYIKNIKAVPMKELPNVELTISAAGIATFCPVVSNVVVPEGVEIFTLGKISGDAVSATLVEGDNIVLDKSAGVLVKGTPGATYTFIGTEDEATDLDGNELIGATEDVVAGPDFYAFKMVDGSPVVASVKAGVVIPAGRAYLREFAALSAPMLRVLFGGEDGLTSTEDVAAPMGENASVMYDLMGKKVNDDYKGVVIVNGKKIIK